MGLLRLPVFVLVAFLTGCLATPRLELPNQVDKTSQPLVDPDDPDVKNERPLIGILAQACHHCPGKSYVAAAFVKWVESAGGRAVPIRFYVSDAELKRLFKSINGLILPGGLTDLWLDDPYVVAARKLYTWAIEENDAGKVFPIWGTCLGHQLLQILTANANYTDLLVETDSVSHPSYLVFSDKAKTSKLFRSMYAERPTLVRKLQDPSYSITMENHEFGLPPTNYLKWPVLLDFYEVLSTSFDRKGVEYVSTIEAKQYPFFGTQWHPEKPPYEYSMKEIPHSHAAISASHHLADVFLDYARRSEHKPESVEEELAMLIYNYHAYFTARDIVMEPSYDGPDITYFFDGQKVPDPEEPGHHPDDDWEAPARAVLTKFQ